jgi:hypothetical protein
VYARTLIRPDDLNRQQEKDESIIKALRDIHEMSSASDGDAWFISAVSLSLTLLFVLIESTPVVAKALSSFDTYDASLQQIEHGAILDKLAAARDKHERVMSERPMSGLAMSEAPLYRAAAAAAGDSGRGD